MIGLISILKCIYSVGADGQNQQVHKVSLDDFERSKKITYKEFKQKTPIITVLSILIERNTTILRYLLTQNLNIINNDILITYLQNYFTVVLLLVSELESRLGLENPKKIGKYCTVSDISISKCLNLTALTSYLIISILRCYDRVGAGISHQLANTVRRLFFYGFLTTRSPKQAMAKVLL